MISLQNILRINSVSSGLAGLLLSFFPNKAAEVFGVTGGFPFMATGLSLILFAAFVFRVSIDMPIQLNKVKIVIALDLLWVVASAIAIPLLVSELSLLGILLIAAVMTWVALMAILQSKAMKTGKNTTTQIH
jgi:hypothetical protein